MGVGPRLAVVLVVAGSVLVTAGVAGASTDPEVEREAAASSTTTATTATTVPLTTSAETSTSASTTATTTTTTTTTTTVPAAGAAEQLPTFYLRGLCSTAGGAFLFAMSNLGSEPVDVALVFNGAPFDTVTLAPGEVYGFRTDAPGTMVAQLPGSSFQTESVAAPCPVEPGSVGLGGLCRDPAIGYQWLLGNAGPDPVDVEVRIGGTVVGAFSVESGGLAGFTTPNGGQAQALVAGEVVAEALSSESPCVAAPASLFAQCVSPGHGYRWFVSNDQPVAAVLEFRVGGVSQAVLSLGPGEGQDVTTSVGGLGELLIGGEVVASAPSEDIACDTQIDLFSPCSDAASGTWWNLTNASPSVAELRLVLNGADLDVVTLQPGETREFSTVEPGRVLAYVGAQLMARGDSALDPCVRIDAVCVDTADGQVWTLEPMRPSVVDVLIGGTPAGTFDLSSGGVQLASPLPGIAEVLIGGTVVDSAEPSTDPCVGLFAECFDTANGYLFVLGNAREEQRTAELRIGAESRTHVLEPFGFVGFALPTPGPVEVFVEGQLVQTVEGSDAGCETPAVLVFATCVSADGYGWELDSQRAFAVAVELRLDGAPAASMALGPGPDFRLFNTRGPGTMQAFVNGVLVAEAPSATEPCSDSPPTVSPSQIPRTGAGPTGLLLLGMSCLAAGLGVLAVARRRDHRTPVRR
jgi:LPXTG-motif cell wall-anchored protein